MLSIVPEAIVDNEYGYTYSECIVDKTTRAIVVLNHDCLHQSIYKHIVHVSCMLSCSAKSS